MGRPVLPEGQVKGILIGARFSPAESKKVAEAAKIAGQNKSQWVRNKLLTAAETALKN